MAISFQTGTGMEINLDDGNEDYLMAVAGNESSNRICDHVYLQYPTLRDNTEI